MMRAEIAGENPTPLEVLLTERVVACWLLVELFEWLMATQLWKGNPPENRVPSLPSSTTSAGKRAPTGSSSLLSGGLARVRKLQSTTPGI
jgi:hypothetical protein